MTKTDRRVMGEYEACGRFVKDLGDRKVIVDFAGTEDMTDLLICYAQRKATLRF